MLNQPPPSRPGITLLEVLAAIFIMGVGLLSLLTLFPLGALSMGRAVRDDRAAAIASSAAGMAAAMSLDNDANLVSNAPKPLTEQYTPPQGFLPPAPDGPGYAVLVDPYYVLLGSSTFGTQTGTPGLARVAPTYATDATTTARWFSFLDEIRFDQSGVPDGAPTKIDRPGTYTWSYLMRRPKSSEGKVGVELSVIVYGSRAVDTVDGETTPAVDTSVAGSNTVGGNSISLTYAAGAKPNVRKDTWIMDVSYVPNAANTGATVNGYCYKVATVTETSTTQLTLEVEPALSANVANVVVMENVIAVVYRGLQPW